jgi:hypothetical protein
VLTDLRDHIIGAVNITRNASRTFVTAHISSVALDIMCVNTINIQVTMVCIHLTIRLRISFVELIAAAMKTNFFSVDRRHTRAGPFAVL